MHLAALITGCLVIGTALWDAFETIALPRTASRRLRLARWFYRVITWRLWGAAARSAWIRQDAGSASWAYYGPLSIFGLLAVRAAGALITGFALLLGSQRALVASLPGDSAHASTCST